MECTCLDSVAFPQTVYYGFIFYRKTFQALFFSPRGGDDNKLNEMIDVTARGRRLIHFDLVRLEFHVPGHIPDVRNWSVSA